MSSCRTAVWGQFPGASALLVAMAALVPVPSSAYELLLDPWRCPRALESLVTDASVLDRFERVHLVVFTNGQTAWSEAQAPFQPLRDGGTGADLARLATACQAQSVKLSWVMDLLCWQCADLPPNGIFGAHPDWRELPRQEPPGRVAPTQYASPFHTDVVEALEALVEYAAGQKPRHCGLTFRCALASDELLGFSRAARRAYIRAASLDPMDLLRGREFADWRLWRERRLQELLSHCVGIGGTNERHATVGWCTGDYYASQRAIDRIPADSWLLWLQEGTVETVLLDAFWHEPRQRATWRICARLASELDPPSERSLIPVVRTRDGADAPCLTEQIAALSAQGAPAGRCALYPVRDVDWPAVLAAAAPGGKG